MLNYDNLILHFGLPCVRYGTGTKVIDSVTCSQRDVRSSMSSFVRVVQ